MGSQYSPSDLSKTLTCDMFGHKLLHSTEKNKITLTLKFEHIYMKSSSLLGVNITLKMATAIQPS